MENNDRLHLSLFLLGDKLLLKNGKNRSDGGDYSRYPHAGNDDKLRNANIRTEKTSDMNKAGSLPPRAKMNECSSSESVLG